VQLKRAGKPLSASDSNFDPSDRAAGVRPGEAKGADIAGAWRAGAVQRWRGSAAAGVGAGGGGEAEE